jgi:hypothetical protein
MNDESSWRKIENVDGKTIHKNFHIRSPYEANGRPTHGSYFAFFDSGRTLAVTDSRTLAKGKAASV